MWEHTNVWVQWPEEGTVSPWTGARCESRDMGIRSRILQYQQVCLTTISPVLVQNLKRELSRSYFSHRPTANAKKCTSEGVRAPRVWLLGHLSLELKGLGRGSTWKFSMFAFIVFRYPFLFDYKFPMQVGFMRKGSPSISGESFKFLLLFIYLLTYFL